MYTWVKRATASEKAEMQEIVDSFNELAPEEEEIHGYLSVYKLERCGDAWGIVEYSEGKEHRDFSFVRCSLCGGIRELADGQIEFCTTCDADWSNPNKAQAANLWREYQNEGAFWNRFELRGFKQKVTKLAKKVDMSDAPTVMYLDNLSLLLEMGSLEYEG